MIRPAVLAIAALTIAIGVRPVQAQIVFDNGGPGTTGHEMTRWVVADDFTLGAPTLLTGFNAWAFGLNSTGSAYQGFLTWQIFANNAGLPGTVLHQGTAADRTPVGLISNWHTFLHRGALNVTLSPGTYWLALHNGPLTTTTGAGYHWTLNHFGGNAASDVAPFDGSWGVQNPLEEAFNLEGRVVSVPEPESMALLATGFMMLGFVGWRRKREA